MGWVIGIAEAADADEADSATVPAEGPEAMSLIEEYLQLLGWTSHPNLPLLDHVL